MFYFVHQVLFTSESETKSSHVIGTVLNVYDTKKSRQTLAANCKNNWTDCLSDNCLLLFFVPNINLFNTLLNRMFIFSFYIIKKIFPMLFLIIQFFFFITLHVKQWTNITEKMQCWLCPSWWIMTNDRAVIHTFLAGMVYSNRNKEVQ